MNVSDYRIRLFLSVDLAGSTAFKAGAGFKPANESSPHPLWIVVIRKFYEAFPASLERHFERRKAALTVDASLFQSPSSWKTIGDEIIFCCRLKDYCHLHLCVLSFIDALKEYGAVLAAEKHQLDVKGTAWIAAFPAINMTATREGLKTTDYLQEKFEAEADAKPSQFDFLGPEIDAGFRISKHSSPDKCAVSLQLAWLLTNSPGEGLSRDSFIYIGRDNLKRVIRDKPYPILCLVSERSEAKAELRRRESRITRRADFEISELHNFLTSFMETEEIESPYLPRVCGLDKLSNLPESYIKFHEQARLGLDAISKEDEQLSDSGDVEDDPTLDGEMPPEVTDALRVVSENKT